MSEDLPKRPMRLPKSPTEALRLALRRMGLSQLFSNRTRLARKYLRGEGIEIGAMHYPLRLPRGAKARYVDIASREESIRKFPDLDPRDLVHVDFITDGFTLEGIPEGAFDFLVANHVLEHSPNPVDTLVRWHRALKPSGILFCSVPKVDLDFDTGRPVTPYAHMLEDYRQAGASGPQVLAARNVEHYIEWLTVSEPAILRRPAPPRAEVERKAALMAETGEEIHFHTFSTDSVRALFEGVGRDVLPDWTVLEVLSSKGEVLAVARKSAPPGRG